MSFTPPRHGRLASLVGALLMAAVAACMVAFSLVAHQAAQRSLGAPTVRPHDPAPGGDPPIVIPGEPDTTVAAEPDDQESSPANQEIEELLALAEAPPPAAPSPPASTTPVDTEPGRPTRAPGSDDPRVALAGADEPGRCVDVRCRREARLRPAVSGNGDVTCRGHGHHKHPERHARGRGKGHCEHGEQAVTGERRVSTGGAKGKESSERPAPANSARGGGRDGNAREREERAGPPAHAASRRAPGRSGTHSPPEQANSRSEAKPAKTKSAPPSHARARGGDKKNARSDRGRR